MKEKLLSTFLIIYGLIHITFELSIYDSNTGDYVGWTRQSWILSDVLGTTAVTIIGLILWSLTVSGFVAAGIMLLMKRKEWRIAAIVTSFISLIAYLFLWDGLAPEPMSWIAGSVVSGIIVIALLIFKWPKDEKLFATKIDDQVLVGVGIINYHFQTKDNLINEAVRYDTNAIIDQWDAIYETMKMPPIDKLKIMLKGTGDLLDTNPLFGRISIIHDYLNPAEDDNTARSTEKYMMIFREIYQTQKTENEIQIIAHTILSGAQLAFIRSNVIKKKIGTDFNNKKHRDEFLDKLVDNLVKI